VLTVILDSTKISRPYRNKLELYEIIIIIIIIIIKFLVWN